MEKNSKIIILSLTLSFVAGFCDTATFVAANELFSAHVTGNFIVFAYDLVNQANGSAWMKLISFPVFFFAVITGGYISSKTVKTYNLLIFEASALFVASFPYLLFPVKNTLASHCLPLIIVFAMGLQNAYGKLFGKDTFGPTTMMTGNVTQAALDVGKFILGNTGEAVTSLFHQFVIIGGFLAGCISGGIAAKNMGLICVAVPSVFLFLLAAFMHRSAARDAMLSDGGQLEGRSKG